MPTSCCPCSEKPFQHYRLISGDKVHAAVDTPLHVLGPVDSPHVHFHTQLVGLLYPLGMSAQHADMVVNGIAGAYLAKFTKASFENVI